MPTQQIICTTNIKDEEEGIRSSSSVDQMRIEEDGDLLLDQIKVCTEDFLEMHVQTKGGHNLENKAWLNLLFLCIVLSSYRLLELYIIRYAQLTMLLITQI